MEPRSLKIYKTITDILSLFNCGSNIVGEYLRTGGKHRGILMTSQESGISKEIVIVLRVKS